MNSIFHTPYDRVTAHYDAENQDFDTRVEDLWLPDGYDIFEIFYYLEDENESKKPWKMRDFVLILGASAPKH